MSGDLRALAEAATPGPWEAQGGLVVAQPGPLAKYVCDAFDEPEASERDAAYIAAANPVAILALLDERDALAAKVARVEALAESAKLDAAKSLSRTFDGGTFGAWVDADQILAALGDHQ